MRIGYGFLLDRATRSPRFWRKAFTLIELLVVVAIIAVAGAIGVRLLGSRVTEVISEKTECFAEVAIVGAAPRIYEEVLRQELPGQRLVSGNLHPDLQG